MLFYSFKIPIILKAQLKCHFFCKSNPNPCQNEYPLLAASPQGWAGVRGCTVFYHLSTQPSQTLSEVLYPGHLLGIPSTQHTVTDRVGA